MANESANANATATSETTTSVDGQEINVQLVDGVCVVTTDDVTTNLTAPIFIEKPAAGETASIDVVPGQKYFFDFNEDSVEAFVQDGDNLTLQFADGSSVILNGFGAAANGSLPATLAFSDALSTDQLATLIQVVDTTPDAEALEEPQAEVRDGDDAADSGEGETDGGDVASVQPAAGEEATAEEVANVEPEAGEPSAQQLANIEPAAGDQAGGNQNSGFSFENFNSDPVGPINAVGPLDPTALQYGVEFQNDTLFPNEEVDPNDVPELTSPAEINLDETNLGPLTFTDTLDFDFGNDGPGVLAPDGSFSFGGSALGGNLTSGGQVVDVVPTADGYIGTINGGATTVFDLVIDPSTGEYTFNQYEVLDHDDPNNPDDIIQLTFGVSATDADGDSATTSIVVNIADDAPAVAAPDSNTVDESTLGPIVINDTLVIDFGNDVPGTVTPEGTSTVTGVTTLTSGGDVITITPTADGYIGTLPGGATAFELVIDPTNGGYTYTQNVPFDHNAAIDTITLDFAVNVTDYDGDTTQTNIIVNITDSVPEINDKPKIGDGLEVVDESDLPGVTANGALTVDFGGDGPGAVTPNDTFDSGGSQLGGSLTSGGQPVTVDLVGDTYVGTINGGADTIFTLQVNPDGSYEFNLIGTLDHADPNDPNDIIDLEFGVTVTDGDGDTDSTTIIVKVKDDVPVIGDSRGDVDETNLDGGPISTSDTLFTNFGTEVGSIQPDGSVSATAGGAPIALTSGSQPVSFAQTATGYVGTINGGADTVFEITVDPSTGQYTYTQFAPFDHPDGTDANDIIELSFGVEVTSTDGDSDNGTITINVADDGPIANDDTTGAEEGQVITGDVTANDDLSEDVDNTVSEVEFNGVTYAVAPGTPAVVTTPLGTLTLNSDGTYTYEATDIGDPDGTDVFTYTLIDSDGDSDTATLSVRVTPDGEPIAVTDTNTVDETNLSPGPLVINETLPVDFGLDGQGSINPNGTTSSGGSLAGGALTSGGQPVEIVQTTDGYVGVIQGTTNQVFELIVQDNGDYSFELFQTLDHADATDPNDLIQLSFGLTVSDSDGDTADGTIIINVLDDAPVAYDDGNTVLQNTTTATGNVVTNDIQGEDAPSTVTAVTFGTNTVAVVSGTPTVINGDHGVLTINADGTYEYVSNGTNVNTEVDEFTYTLTDFDGDSDTAELTITIQDINTKPKISAGFEVVDETDLPGVQESGQLVVDYGADGPGEVQPNDTFTAGGSLLGGNLTSGGQPVTVTLVGDTYVGHTGADPNLNQVFTLEVNTDGSYTFDLLGTLDHADPNDPNDIITLEFGVNAVDSDGDATPSTILINVLDDVPVIGDSRGDVDETNFDNGPLTYSDTLFTNFGTEVGSITPGGSVTATVGGNPITLTSGGNTVSFAQTANGYEGTINGGATTVFTITVDPVTGQYVYTQFAPFDHPDGADPNDIIELNFGVDVVSTDGDSDTGTITIAVADDGPIANDDVNGAAEGQDIVGSVVANDELSEDTPNTVTQFEYNGTTYTIPDGGSNSVVTPLGTFTLNSDGTYSFDAVDSGDPDGTATFIYTLVDADGDSDTAELSIRVTPNGEPVAVTAENTVDETNLSPGPLVINESLNVDFGDDGAGSVSGNGTSSFGGSVANGNLTSNDVPVEIRQTANGYEGVLQGTDTQVFELILQDNGDYSFELFGPLDHSEPKDPNDTITLNFGVTVTDADNDTADGSLTIHVLDDAPIANDDHNTYDTTFGVANGNVITGLNGGPGAADDLSEDNAAPESADHDVVQVRFGATTVDIPAGGSNTIEGTYGTLEMFDDGSYTYTLKPGVTLPGTGGSDTLDPNSGDVAGTQTSFTKNNITVTSTTGQDLTWLNHTGTGIGVGGNDKVWPAPEALNVDFALAESVTFKIGDIGSNNQTSDLQFDITFQDGTTETVIFDIATTTPVNGIVEVTFNSSDFGGKLIDSVELPVYQTSFVLNDVTVKYPGEDCIIDQFEYVLQDGDGDQSTATLELCGKDLTDDQPDLTTSKVIVDETNIVDTDSDSISADFGTDGPGTYTVTGAGTVTHTGGTNGQLTSNGVTVDVTVEGNDYVGRAGGDEIFRLELNSTTGEYEFTLTGVLDHADTTDPDDIIELSFGVTATDSDGDTDTGSIIVQVKDDGPVANDDCNEFTVEATNKDFNIVMALDVSGSMSGDKIALLKSSVANLLADFNAYNSGEIKVHIVPFSNNAGAGETFTVTNDAEFNAAIDYLNGMSANGTTNYEAPLQSALSWLNGDSDNDPIVGADTYSYFVSDGEPNRYLNNSGSVTTGSADVVMGEITGSDGTDEVAELQALSTEVIGVGIGVNGTTLARLGQIDSDGTALDVQDPTDLDAALQGTNPLAGQASGNVITGAGQTPGGADDLSNDVENTVTQIAFGTNSVDVDPVNGASIDGAYGTLTINADGSYTYKVTATDITGDITENFVYTLTDGDGDKSTATLSLKGKFVDVNDEPDLTTSKVIVDETDLNPTDEASNSVTADFGGDGPGSYALLGLNGFNGALNNQLTSNGVAVNVANQGGDLVGLAGTEEIFRLALNETTGQYTFTLSGTLDHANPDNHDDVIQLLFDVQAEDSDGDTDSGIITVKVRDDGPSISGKAKLIHEDALETQASVSYTATLNHDYGEDGPGEIRTTDTFTAKFQMNGPDVTLTSGGVNIVVTETADGYVGRANGQDVFTLVVRDNGSYTYTQFEPIDHPDGNNPDDVIWLKFGVQIVDADGDTADATIVVDVHDGAPTAVDDTDSVTKDQTTTSGNVITNDHTGPDTPVSVTMINGQNIAQAGITIQGTYGSLTINPDGSYTYVSNGTNTNDVQEVFTYKLTDFDGDSDEASLTIDVPATKVVVLDDEPEANDDRITEADLAGGNVYRGNLLDNDDFGDDGRGSPAITDGDGFYTFPHGTLEILTNGEFTLTLDRSVTYNHNYTLNYTIQDSDGDTDSAVLRFSVTPLALDLDGDGIELTNVVNGVQFDYDVDGETEQTAWVKSDDGFLVQDRNDDGVINDRSEMFGDIFGFSDGFSHLGSLDSNNDGQITSADEQWSDLKVWRDLDQDGVSDEGELFGLDALNIASIDLDAERTDETVEDNYISHVASYTTTDGESRDIVDVHLNYEENSADDQAALDLANYLQGYDALQESIDDFVFHTEAEAAVEDGAAQTAENASNPSAAAVIESVTGLSLEQIVKTDGDA